MFHMNGFHMNSVSHEWLIKLVYLPKLLEDLFRGNEYLTSMWSTILHRKAEEEITVPDAVHSVKGVFQDDILSVLLFILSVNPLSFLLHKLKGYTSKHKNYNITHNFVINDLKLYGSSTNTANKQLDLATVLSKDT